MFQFQSGAISLASFSATTREGIQQTVRQAIEKVFQQTASVMAAAA